MANTLFNLFTNLLLPILLATDCCSVQPDRSSNYTYDQMLESVPQEFLFDILRGRCDVETPLSPNMSSASAATLAVDSCGEMTYMCNNYSIRDVCDMITNMNAPTCSCQEDCEKYSSCCHDHVISPEDLSHVSELNRMNECRRPFRESRDAYIIRSYCSANWSSRSESGFTIKDACEEADRLSVRERMQLLVNGSNFEKDFLSELLVTSTRSSITYKNIFCLVCNFEFYEDTNDDELLFWPMIVKCLETPEALAADPKAGCILDHKASGMHPADERYEAFRSSLIPCYAEDDGVIIDCPRSYNYDIEQQMIRVRCGAIFSPVREMDGKSTIYFRNEWCARCRGVAYDKIFCMDGYLPRRLALGSSRGSDANKYTIELNDTSVTAERRKGERSDRRCKPTEIFDPFIGTCRLMLCHRHEDCRIVHSSAVPSLISYRLVCIVTGIALLQILSFKWRTIPSF